MMKFDIREYVRVYSGIVPEQVCDDMISKLSTEQWTEHYFTDSNGINKGGRSDKELSFCYTEGEANEFIKETFNYVRQEYQHAIGYTWWTTNTITTPRYNKYDLNSAMALHCDHIHSIFDGDSKGVPILTMLGVLNDDYEGGELMIFEDDVIELKKGDLVVFPSNFMYPHKVNPVKSGVRYSYVGWAF